MPFGSISWPSPLGMLIAAELFLLSLPAIAGWLRISGLKRFRIFGTDSRIMKQPINRDSWRVPA
jgi:hypothetical protein